MKRTEYITINFLFCTEAELKSAERKQARLENAGYTLISQTANCSEYRLMNGQVDPA